MSKTIYTKDPNRFYVYAFLREDGSPYYIGKGTGNRAWGKRQFRPTDDSRISILKGSLTETEAFDEERHLIQFYGRKDLGTGILRNLTDGGEGSSGCKRSQETRDKQSVAQTGKTGEKSSRYGKKHTQDALDKISAAMTGKKQSAETIAKKSAAMSGEKNPMFGKKRTQEFRDKMSEEHSGENNPMYGTTGEKSPRYGKKHTQDTRDKLSAARKRNTESGRILLENPEPNILDI